MVFTYADQSIAVLTTCYPKGSPLRETKVRARQQDLSISTENSVTFIGGSGGAMVRQNAVHRPSPRPPRRSRFCLPFCASNARSPSRACLRQSSPREASSRVRGGSRFVHQCRLRVEARRSGVPDAAASAATQSPGTPLACCDALSSARIRPMRARATELFHVSRGMRDCSASLKLSAFPCARQAPSTFVESPAS